MSKEDELGTLAVIVLKARNLIDKHSFYKQDVFAQAVLNGSTEKTQVDVKGGQQPVWDAELRFPILQTSSAKSRTLEISAFCKDSRSNEHLGTGKVDISDTLKTGEFDEWVPLSMLLDSKGRETPNGREGEDGVERVQRGEVFLEMTFFSNAPPPAPAPAPVDKGKGRMTGIGAGAGGGKGPTLIPPGSQPLARRPSKWAPKERLARPASYYQVPDFLQPGRSAPTQQPSPPSSRSSSHSPKHRDDPLPPLPQAGVPPSLRPGKTRQPVQDIPPGPAPSFPLPNVMIAPATPAPHEQPMAHGYYDYRQPYPPAQHPPQQQQQQYPLPPSPQRYSSPPPLAQQQHPQPPPQQQYTIPPHQYAPPAPNQHRYYVPPQEHSSAPPPQHWQQQQQHHCTSSQGDFPDPYLIARYQSPLPLPPGALPPTPPTGPEPQHMPTPPRRAPSPPSPQTIALEQARKRREQEEADRELARQLDRELNLLDSHASPPSGTPGSSGT